MIFIPSRQSRIIVTKKKEWGWNSQNHILHSSFLFFVYMMLSAFEKIPKSIPIIMLFSTRWFIGILSDRFLQTPSHCRIFGVLWSCPQNVSSRCQSSWETETPCIFLNVPLWFPGWESQNHILVFNTMYLCALTVKVTLETFKLIIPYS